MINFIGSQAQTGHKQTTTQQKTTGYEGDNDILKNIYDLEGNNLEWTAQADGTDSRGHRGGFYRDASYGKFYPASYKSFHNPDYISDTYCVSTSRLSIYL